MEAMKMNVILMVVLMAFPTIQKVAVAEAPAPSPTSDGSLYFPIFIAIAFGFFL
ncbi:hypothetical protein K2173_021525 [Erythroxylum novogranatense]|uniref:Uncharacterized protein n=1 Tax=Erythroxylum novogranatense TaxID=1862640 RepID=A0AAV8TN56_9ROSI|nr:hypothetical protein K2173_021525 [Erythroxylum novogranatense]